VFWRRPKADSAQPQAAEVPLQISGDELQTELRGGSPPLLVDVRSAEEFASGYIPGAVLIPLPELERRVGEIPSGRSVVCVCRSGHRSGIAARQLRARGYSARSLAQGMMGWRGSVKRR